MVEPCTVHTHSQTLRSRTSRRSEPIVKDIPRVGASLTDHPVVYATFRARQGCEHNNLYQVSFRAVKSIARYTPQGWAANLQRSCSSSISCVQPMGMRFVISRNGRIFRSFPSHLYMPISDPSFDPYSPDLELLAGPSSFPPHGKAMVLGMGVTPLRYVVCLELILCKLHLRSLARGTSPMTRVSIELNSSDPLDWSLIDPK